MFTPTQQLQANNAATARRHLQNHAAGNRKLKAAWVARYLQHIAAAPPTKTRTINATLAMLASQPRNVQTTPQFTAALLATAQHLAARLANRRAAVAKYAAKAHTQGINLLA